MYIYIYIYIYAYTHIHIISPCECQSAGLNPPPLLLFSLLDVFFCAVLMLLLSHCLQASTLLHGVRGYRDVHRAGRG